MALVEDVVHVDRQPSDSAFALATKDVVSSIFGSAACVYTGQPLDTIKVRMQARPDAFSGVWQCLRRTLAEERITALWKGSTPALSGAVMENMVAFGVNEQLKRLFPDDTRPKGAAPPWWQSIVFGGATGLFTTVVLCPNDVIKCKVQVSRSLKAAEGTVGGVESLRLPALNASEMMRHVLRTQGVRGLFVGLGAQFARDVPFYASFFGTYDTVVEHGKALPFQIPVELLYMFAGGMAGVVGWAAVMPMDTAKSIIQTSSKPESLMKTIMKVHKTKGWRSLFTGLNAALVRAFPANAALFLGYEVARRSM